MSDLIDRQALLDEIDNERKSLLDMGMKSAEHIVVHHARRVIEELPSVNLEEKPCEDAISREVAIAEIEDLRNKLIELGDLYEHKYEHSAYGLDYAEQIIGKLPSVNPQEPKYCDRNICIKNEYNNIGCDECEVTKSQEPKTGHWIDEGWYAEGHSEHAYRCSECEEQYIGYVGEYKHCPNCGARMEGCK